MTNLTILRKQKGLSQSDLAVAVGLTRQEVSRLENGWIAKIRPDVADRLRSIFGPTWTFPALLREPTISNDATAPGVD
jgi:transcriptional regulator with XRE-family HTH domain